MVFSISTVNLINMLFIAAGIGVCSLCFLQITASRHLSQEVRRYFQFFFILIIIYISTHLARQLMDGITGNGVRTTLYIITLAEVIAAGVMTYMLSMLVLSVSRPEKNVKKLLIILLILLGIHTIILMIGSFTDLIFYFDENNSYHRAGGYLLSNVCPILMMGIDIVLIHHLCYRRRRGLYVFRNSPEPE